MKISFKIGDITKEKVDVIVNSANKSLLKGSGVCGAIHRASGKELEKECVTIRKNILKNQDLEAGKAVITSAFNLPASFVIHTVGPKFKEKESERKLFDCYTECFELANHHQVKTIAFPSISTGVHGYPIKEAAKIAIEAAHAALHTTIEETVFVLFSKEDFEVYQQTFNERKVN